MNKGLIADSYENSFLGYYFERGTISWTKNYNTFQKRKRGVLRNIDRLSPGQLATLAPSEKYDILLGDLDFDLTNRIWDFMQRWGNRKEYGFLSDLALVGEDSLAIAKEMVGFGWFPTVEDAFTDAYQLRGSLAVDEALRLVKEGEFDTIEDAMPLAIQSALVESRNYVVEKRNNLMAWWEGICHGWATAAGVIPRPRKAVNFELPDGRNLRFYPTDIKALASMLFANSLIQDMKIVDEKTGENVGGGVISEGLRCNLKSAGTDEWGRRYDNQKDPFGGDLSPRCVGVHPAIWHLGLVNLIGKQGRSFIVDQKVSEEVDNHPMYAYKMLYFHPYRAEQFRNIRSNIVKIDGRDEFRAFRSPKAKYLIGVQTFMTYIDWARPQRFLKDDERFDRTVTKNMFYDLELDENYNVVGGQWRTSMDADGPSDEYDDASEANYNQPDFLWVITKDYNSFFKEIEGLEKWEDTSKAPPASWLATATAEDGAHAFVYQEKYKYSTGKKCKVYHRRTGKMRKVSCEFEVPKPQPLVNLVNKLIELSQ